MKRNADGTFARGSEGGPGRPSRQTEARYMEVVMTVCDLEAWRDIVQKAVDDAKTGDTKAREWLTNYVLGKPGPYTFAPRPAEAYAELELMEQQEHDPVEMEKAAILHQDQLKAAMYEPRDTQSEPPRRCEGKVRFGQTYEPCDRPATLVWRDTEYEHHFCDLHHHYQVHGRLPPLEEENDQPAA